jgi:CHASE2 domain-containing sensor protein
MLCFIGCKNHERVDIQPGVDHEIVLVNLEQMDRASIGRLLLTIDSCKPAVIALSVYLEGEKDPYNDSILMAALRTVKNDVLIYSIDPSSSELKATHAKFGQYASAMGRYSFKMERGMSTGIVPLERIDGKIHELFPLTIVKLWKPGFQHSFREGESIPIHYTKLEDQFLDINGSIFSLENVDSNAIRNKVVIVGYLGPDEEDRQETPTGSMYGAFIVANAVRTILEYEKK